MERKEREKKRTEGNRREPTHLIAKMESLDTAVDYHMLVMGLGLDGG